MGVDQRLHLGVATHERKLGGRRHGRSRGLGSRLEVLGGGGERPVVDLLEESRGLRERCDAQLVTHDAHAGPVLLEGGAAIATPRVEAHELSMRRLVQWVELQPSPRQRNGAVQVAGGDEVLDQPAEGRGQLTIQRTGLTELPVVERRAVPQGEALEEGPRVQLDGLGQLPRRGLGPGHRSEALDVDGQSALSLSARRRRHWSRATHHRSRCAAWRACAAGHRGPVQDRDPGRATRTALLSSAGDRSAPGGRAAPSPCGSRTSRPRRRGPPAAGPATGCRGPCPSR